MGVDDCYIRPSTEPWPEPNHGSGLLDRPTRLDPNPAASMGRPHSTDRLTSGTSLGRLTLFAVHAATPRDPLEVPRVEAIQLNALGQYWDPKVLAF